MAGVNVSEENARILASGSELVGSVIRSCQEEPFLFPSALQTRVLHVGNFTQPSQNRLLEIAHYLY